MAKDLSTINITLTYEEKPAEEISLIGFLFYWNGLYLQQALVRNAQLVFNVSDIGTSGDGKPKSTAAPKTYDIRQLQVYIAPATDKRIQDVRSLEELEPYKPYSPILQTDANGTISVLPIPGLISRFWPLCHCRVTGKVSKWFSVNNNWEDRAVCRARVTIYDIDAIWYWIYRIPDYIIARIPAAILNPQEVIKFPIPRPDPPPFAVNIAATGALETKSLFRTSSVEEKQMAYSASLPELTVEIRQTLASGNLNQIRETIATNYTLFHPWFCLWPIWWPWFYRRRELAVVYTDASGRFDTSVDYWCTGDKPDIYITVDYLINGVWTSVYAPPIPCYTFWDYVCGTNIGINITDPRVPGDCCCDCGIPGEVVWIRTVGSTSVSHINQANYSQAPTGQTVPFNRQGLTDAPAEYDPSFLTVNIKNGDYQRPFGGTPTFVVGFGTDLPNAGTFYYRWSYKKVADAALSPVGDSYKPLLPVSGVTVKGYEYTYIDIHGETQFGSKAVILGPQLIGPNNNLYIIPPESPAMAPFSVPETDPQWNERTYANLSISFDSSDLRDATNAKGDGLYAFKLELFDQTGALLTNLPKATFNVPDFDTPGFSVDAPTSLLLNPTATTADGYNMLMRIDNSSCQADIYTVKVNGVPASSDCCGFVSYDPDGVEATLDISFEAEHPNNFAVFSFSVERGTCGNVGIADATGMVIDSADGYIRNGSSIYDKAFTPAQLLESCYGGGAGKAAFAEVLSVAATATDGTYRQIAKDAGDVAAFALEP